MRSTRAIAARPTVTDVLYSVRTWRRVGLGVRSVWSLCCFSIEGLRNIGDELSCATRPPSRYGDLDELEKIFATSLPDLRRRWQLIRQTDAQFKEKARVEAKSKLHNFLSG